MRKIHAAALGLALAGGPFVVTEVPAAAKAYCERYTQAPAFIRAPQSTPTTT